MQENCSKLINALLEVQEKIKISTSPTSRAASPNPDWVSVDIGCSQCESLQSSLQDHLRKLGELSGQIHFVTSVLLQMHEALLPAVDITRAKQHDDPTCLPQPSSPPSRQPRSTSDLPANLIATVMEFASHEDPSATLKLSCVNRPFRRIALSNPHLWSRINLTALRPDAVQLHLQRSKNRRLDISLTYLTDVSVDREVGVWKTLLGNHTQRVVSLAISAPARLSFALASDTIRLWHLPSLRLVELQVVHGSGPSNPPKRLLLWDAFDMDLNSIELSGNLTERLEETLSFLQQLEKPDRETGKDLDRDSAMRVTDEQDTTADLLAGSLQRLEVTSTSQAALPDADMNDQTPRQEANALPAGTPDEMQPKQPQAGVLSSTSTVVERSESTCVKVTGFSQTTPLSGKSPCPTEAGLDAMETDSTGTHSVATMPDGSILVSSDACGPPRRREDLDPEDMDDPTMVGEYVSEIYDYLRKLEVTVMADPDYMKRQPEFTWKARGTLADWMMKAHSSFHLLPETYWLAMNLLDRFLSRRTIAIAKAQLLGSGCLLIASKFNEISPPSPKQWAAVCCNVFGENEIRVAERYVLKTLEYKISSPNPLDFLRRMNRADDYNIQLRTAAKYLSLIQCFRDQLLSIRPSLLAASAYWLARIALQKFEWTESHIYYSGYQEDQLIPHANLMVSYLLEPVTHEEFHRVSSTPKNLKTATAMREWASKNWTRPQEGSEPAILPVDLSQDLIRLKEQSTNEPCCSS
ncbi:G2/mitotic-specific cyclin [Tulasnella sp. UAMH 9824]|nr:G2/mitotic-specific cyclin [Tulasnella sp. UAMH 9824]